MEAPSAAVGLEEKKIVETVDVSWRACPFDEHTVDATSGKKLGTLKLGSQRWLPYEKIWSSDMRTFGTRSWL